ncbi:MAG: 50S ribosomal protein L5 [Patescibacteria group bacterium]
MQKTHEKVSTEVRAHIEKVVVNTGTGRLSSQPHFEDKLLPEIMKEFALITGQKPRTNPAKRSIAGFKLREGAVVGISTTLRGKRMKEFIDRLNRIVFPRIRDFRGLSISGVDSRGNLTVGIKEHIVFPEVNQEDSKVSFGLQVSVIPKRALPREQAIHMYRELGFPLAKQEH